MPSPVVANGVHAVSVMIAQVPGVIARSNPGYILLGLSVVVHARAGTPARPGSPRAPGAGAGVRFASKRHVEVFIQLFVSGDHFPTSLEQQRDGSRLRASPRTF
ncbi:hypothetical protein GSI_01406 [Ganoderma sinense ZZ0214-1]|uniref:Uncharacterized protein n=1 Tax=Ganoderma sinense ZZ0214-1 TaxID=1077348 RepID=A0A2G8SVF2_9APHY|nr:hypothetical protein GSI_01406 [Ganoderma sinense ZZ0214-1]